MSKIGLIQLVAVMNSLTESFEVTKWYDMGKGDPQQMMNGCILKLLNGIEKKRQIRK